VIRHQAGRLDRAVGIRARQARVPEAEIYGGSTGFQRSDRIVERRGAMAEHAYAQSLQSVEIDRTVRVIELLGRQCF
ncbi:hypothetical protein ACC763_40635, partial [Rhizobium ruizarguesonis]